MVKQMLNQFEDRFNYLFPEHAKECKQEFGQYERYIKEEMSKVNSYVQEI